MSSLPTYRIKQTRMPEFTAIESVNFEKSSPVYLLDTTTSKNPKQKTEARLAWDEKTLYGFFSCQDIQPFATFTKHDDPLYEEDVVELFIDPLGLGNIYYELEINPLNASFDAIIINNISQPGRRGKKHQCFTDWNPASFIHKTKNTDTGWEAILAIEFDDLFIAHRIPPKPGDTWRGNMLRCDVLAGISEYTAWSPTGLPDFHNTRMFGTWVFE